MQVLTTMASGHHESHGSPYAQDSWMGMGHHYSQSAPQHHVSPMHEYQGFDYSQSPMPLEPAYAMPRPPPYAASHHPLPPPLIMPQSNVVWPSMLTSQSAYQTPILPAGSMHTPVSAAPSHGSDITPTSAKSASRRKLTDEERRQMCLEAEQNPTMKQTQIGAKFNVERSTVSKILRQKDKYMKPIIKEEVTSPGKKPKVKLPDVEKTLANWVRNQQKKNIPITDAELLKQAHMFSAGRSDQQFLSSPTWLEQFKQKHMEHMGDASTPILDTALEGSPASSSGLASPPTSASDDRPLLMSTFETVTHGYEFEDRAPPFDQQDGMRHHPLVEVDPTLECIISPVSPDLRRRDGLAVSMPESEHVIYNFSRQRSQTFHQLSETVARSNSTPTHKAPSLPVRSMTNTAPEMTRNASVDPRKTMKRHKSVPDIHDAGTVRYSSMQPPPLPRSADLSPISNPSSPTAQDDNIRALYSIQKLLEQRPDVAEPDDYVMIGKLMEKLKLLRSANGTPILPAGMHPLEVSRSPRNSKKRTILGIST